MGIKNGLLVADVMHQRLRPRKNGFVYKVYYLCLPLENLKKPEGLKLLSFNKMNFFSVMDKDHGNKESQPMEKWINGILSKWQLTETLEGGSIVLLTLPRVLGYIFNPVSFWFCLDKTGKLRAVLSEVNNTRGERHCYISFHKNKKEITQDDVLEAKKVFYVSPFLKVQGYYKFRFAYKEDKVGVWIDYFDEEGEILKTSLVGKREELTDKNLVSLYLKYPFITLKVIALIHWQALKLVAKRIRFYSKPTPPEEEVTQ